MLIGAHVSPSGGPAKAVERGVERGARSIQIFNQNPRQWKPREYSDEEVADFHAAMADSDVDALLIHAVYLLNCASEEAEIREKTLASLIASLRAGAELGAQAVVLHPGSALKKGGDVDAAIERAGEVITEALAESEKCPLHLEDTAGAGGTLGRSFEELARLIEVAGGGKRLGVCLDSCHLLASGYDIRTAEALVGRARRLRPRSSASTGSARCTSTTRRPRSAPTATATRTSATARSARAGIAAFLSEPRFEGMPCVLEGPGHAGKGLDRQDLDWAFKLRKEGLAARGGAKRKRAGRASR